MASWLTMFSYFNHLTWPSRKPMLAPSLWILVATWYRMLLYQPIQTAPLLSPTMIVLATSVNCASLGRSRVAFILQP